MTIPFNSRSGCTAGQFERDSGWPQLKTPRDVPRRLLQLVHECNEHPSQPADHSTSLQPWDAGRGGGPNDGVICQALKRLCLANMTSLAGRFWRAFFLGSQEPLGFFSSSPSRPDLRKRSSTKTKRETDCRVRREQRADGFHDAGDPSWPATPITELDNLRVPSGR